MKLYCIAFGVSVLMGCGTTPADLRDAYPNGEFASTKLPHELAVCLNKNATKRFGAHITSMIPTSETNFEISVVNGSSAWVAMEVEPLNTINSNAIIRLSGPAKLGPKTTMLALTSGCS